MQRLEPIIALIALVVAVLVAFGVYHLVYTAPQQKVYAEHCPPLPEMKEVMIAKSIINTGDAIEDAVVYEKWPLSNLGTEFYVKNQVTHEQLKSLIARRIINQGEPITKNSVVDRKDRGILSALLNEGMRAVSIGLDQNSAMSGLLNPGDIVDVIVALNTTGKEKENEETNRTILCGVRVLAVDQRLSNSVELVNKKITETLQAPKSVTLEVTPQQASSLASAGKLGTLSLSLHSTNDLTKERKDSCVEASLKPMEQIKIVRGDGSAASQQKP